MDRALKTRLLTTLEWVCRIVVAALFLLAAVPKLLDPLAFAKAIANYRVPFPLVGQDYIYPVAIFLPALELVAALALLWNRTKRAGSLAVGGLLILFTVLIAQAVLRGLNIDCGCFGTGAISKALAAKAGVEKIVENGASLAAMVFVFLYRAPSPATSRQTGSEP
jgi:putative oxidoreductase